MRFPSYKNLNPAAQGFFWAAIIFAISLIIRIYALNTLPINVATSSSLQSLVNHYELIVNIIIGSLTCSVVYFVAHHVYSRRWFGIVTGLILAFQPWHIFFSVSGGSEIIIGFLILLSTYFMLRRSAILLSLTAALVAIISFETWIILIMEALHISRELRGKKVIMVLPFGAIAVMGFLFLFYPQASLPVLPSCTGDRLEISGLLFYFSSLFLMTFSLFYLGFVFALLKNKESRVISTLVITFVIFLSLLSYGWGCQDSSKLIIIMPLISAMIAIVMPKFQGGNLRKALVFIALFFILVIPYLAQISFMD